MALSGTTALIGGGGRNYIFSGSGASWSQQAELKVPGGWSVALSSGTALIGDFPFETAYVFAGSGASWSQQAELGPPVSTTAPALSGTATVGNKLTCSTGSWAGTPTPTSFTYQWLRGGSAIAGATTSSYTVASADQTAALSCRVTAQNSAGATSATSNALTVPPTGPPYATVAPSIGGTGVVGQTVTCSTGTWVGLAPITYAFQWLRNGAAISGATKSSYLVTSADLLTALGCRVTATNTKGAVSATSTIGVPQSGVPADIVAPLVSGTPVVGQKLTCSSGIWAGAQPQTYSRQWSRNGVAISGATGGSTPPAPTCSRRSPAR